MFNNQENLFLQAIQKMLSSTDNVARTKAESDIILWAKDSYVQILETCNKFIICEQLATDIRRYSCYLMTIFINEENTENFQKLEPDLKNSIRMNSLSLLGSKNSEIRLSASILVSSIEKISIKNREWPNLITTLCKACDSDEIEFKLSSIRTLGLIWEDLKKEKFSDEELILMENTIIKILLSSNDKNLSYESLGAYQYFLTYIYKRFQNEEYLQSTLKMLTNFCNYQKYNEDIAIKAIHRITDVVIIAYDYMENNIKNIIEFFGVLCNGKNEQLAIQSYIFLIELGQEEYERLMGGLKYNNYLSSCWNILWGIIKNTLNTTIDPSSNGEFNRFKSLSSLLFYLSKICNEEIIDDIFIFMNEKMNDQNPIVINSAIYAFACILETSNDYKIKKVIYSSIKPLAKFINIKCDELNKTVGWCFEKICENHGNYIICNPDACKQILTLILTNLKNGDLHPKVKIYLCTSLFYLCNVLKVSELNKLGIFSHYLLDLLKILDYLAYLPNSFDVENNLSRYCFFAISGLIKSSKESDDEILSLYLEKLMERFTEAQNVQNFPNKEIQYQTQSYLCIVLDSFCKEGIKVKMSYSQIELFYNSIELYFKQRGIFEEGLQALSKLSLSISNKEFSNFMKVIMEHIFECLKEYQAFSNCKVALLCLIDLITTSKENFLPYLDRLIVYFQEIMQKPDANKEIFCYFLIIFSDLFEFLGESIWEYVQVPLDYMKYVLDFCINNYDKYISENVEKEDYSYFLIMNDNVMDLIENISKRIIKENDERKKAFFQYGIYIVSYLNFMLGKSNFVPHNDYLVSCMSTLFDLMDIYKDEIISKIDNNTSRRISQLSNATKDGEIIHINDSLQSYIYASKYKLQLNKDEIF